MGRTFKRLAVAWAVAVSGAAAAGGPLSVGAAAPGGWVATGGLGAPAQPVPAQPGEGGPNWGGAVAPPGYEGVEQAGELTDSKTQVEGVGRVVRFKDGYLFGAQGSLVRVHFNAGFRPYAGQALVVFRDDGTLSTQRGRAVGDLLQTIAVLRVTRADGGDPTAAVLTQYYNILPGDRLAPRDARLKAYLALKGRPQRPPRRVSGEVVGMIPPKLMAGDGDVVYLDVGSDQGVVPGTRLRVVSQPEIDGYGNDSDDSVMPMYRIAHSEPPEDDLRDVASNGTVAVARVVNATRHGCSARVYECVGVVRMGDQVKFP